MRHSNGLTIVMYHSICENPDAYAVSPTAFSRQMDFLVRNYRVIRLKNARSQLSGISKDERCVAVTFDDAFSDFATAAYPILRRSQTPASVFVPTGLVGRTNAWDASNHIIRQRPIMSANDIQQLHADGIVDFGSHTVDHLSMADIPAREMERQAFESKRYLEMLLRTPITIFAYPYGQLDNFSRITTQVLTEIGYDTAVTTHWGTDNSTDNLLSLKRIHFREIDDATTLRAKIEGGYDWIGAKERAGFAMRWMCKRARLTFQHW